MYAKRTILGMYSPAYVKLAIRSKRVASSARSVHPGGAALIFAVAWLAGFSGSVSVLLAAVALFAGLHLARVAMTIAAPAPVESSAVVALPAVSTVHGLAEALAGGLTIKSVQFCQLPVSKIKGA